MKKDDSGKSLSITRRSALKGMATTAGVAAASLAAPGIIRRASAADPIKVGVISPLTGAWTVYGKAHSAGFELAVDEINAAGGVLGRKIVFTTRDSKFKVDIGLSAAKELIYRENVDILMGTINSALALAISDMCKKEKVPFFATFSKSAKITGAKGHRYVFSVTENTALAGKALTTQGAIGGRLTLGLGVGQVAHEDHRRPAPVTRRDRLDQPNA